MVFDRRIRARGEQVFHKCLAATDTRPHQFRSAEGVTPIDVVPIEARAFAGAEIVEFHTGLGVMSDGNKFYGDFRLRPEALPDFPADGLKAIAKESKVATRFTAAKRGTQWKEVQRSPYAELLNWLAFGLKGIGGEIKTALSQFAILGDDCLEQCPHLISELSS